MNKLLVCISVLLAGACGLLGYEVLKTHRSLDDALARSRQELAQLQIRLDRAVAAPQECARVADTHRAGMADELPAIWTAEAARMQPSERVTERFAIAERNVALTRQKLKTLRAYGPLLRRLRLPQIDEDELVELLGVTLESPDPDERRESEQKIISKLDLPRQQIYLEYERTLAARRSLDRMDYDLQSLGIPLTEDQREFLISAMATTREAFPAPDIRSNSMEDFETFIRNMDEIDRRVFDQARTVLSQHQARFVQTYFDAESADRHSSLEETRRRRARGQPNAPLMWRPPGRL